MKLKHLSLTQEIRAEQEGIIEGYVAVWDTIDSYNSRFQRGAFKKTIENRLNKIKVLWNHDTDKPIGRLLDIREDDHGLWVKAQLIMEVEKAKEAFNLIRGGAIDCFSFGFRTIKDKYENGVQVITEVMLGEISPVVFEANSNAKIMSARSEKAENEMELINKLELRLADILWQDSEDKIDIIENVINEFKDDYIDCYRNGNIEKNHSNNELEFAFRTYLNDNDTNVEDVAKNTSFTVEELRSLSKGELIADQSKLELLGKDVCQAFNKVRCKAVNTLCDELRTGLDKAEVTRIKSLVSKNKDEADLITSYLSEFRKKLEK